MLGELTRAVYGTITRPVRSGPWSMFTNGPPEGWLSDRAPAPFAWLGFSPNDAGVPTGPNGPRPTFDGGPIAGLPSASERAVGLIAGPLVASMPWRVYRGSYRGDVTATEVTPPPLWLTDPQLLGSRPGPAVGSVVPVTSRVSAQRLFEEWICHAILFGRGYLAYAEDAYGAPLAGTLRVLAPSAVGIPDDSPGVYELGEPPDTLRTDTEGRVSVGGRVWRLVRLDEPHGDGSGVLGRHAPELGLAVQVRRYASGTFRSGIPAGYLKVTSGGLTSDAAERLKSRWLEAHGGDRRSIAVLNASTEFHPISVTPVDAELLGMDLFTTRHVAHAFNLRAWALDAGNDSMVYQTARDNRRAQLDETLMPWKRQIEGTVSACLPYGTWLELDTRGYLETDPAARMGYYRELLGIFGRSPALLAQIANLERIPPEALTDTTPDPTPPTEEAAS